MTADAAGCIIGIMLSRLTSGHELGPRGQAVSRPAAAFDAPRSYLLVSAGDPPGAAAAVSVWAEGPPDLCVTSPSPRAHDAAVVACAGRFVWMIDEPLLASRQSLESADDFAARYAEALRVVLALDTRAALVVCDEVPVRWRTPLFVDDESLLRRVELTERELPLP
jgi:hypothetical protein